MVDVSQPRRRRPAHASSLCASICPPLLLSTAIRTLNPSPRLFKKHLNLAPAGGDKSLLLQRVGFVDQVVGPLLSSPVSDRHTSPRLREAYHRRPRLILPPQASPPPRPLPIDTCSARTTCCLARTARLVAIFPSFHEYASICSRHDCLVCNMLVVKALNGDASFLLVFAPSIAPDTPSVAQFPGAFTVLIDPWLTGPAKILTSAFSVSHHQAQPCVSSLADLPEPDLVIVSQDKPDHCHKETLTQLPPDTQSLIVAAPAAAARIRKWKHFKPNVVQSLPLYSATDQSTILRIELPSFSPLGSPGQVTVSLISQKNDITGLHKAIGITYRAPTSVLTPNRHTLINLPTRPSPSVKTSSLQTQSTNTSTSLSSGPKPSPKPRAASIDVTIAAARLRDARETLSELNRPSKPISAPQQIRDNPTTIRSARSHSSIASALTSAGPGAGVPDASPTRDREPTLSVLYSPHGVPYAALEPFVTAQLVGHAALPLTLLLHGFDRVDNPWFLGGNISTGAEGGGADIARRLMARAWVAAHDGEKRNRGVSVSLLRTRRVGLDEVRRRLAVNADGVVKRASTRILRLASGEELRVK